ncbi:hypothetical protein TNCV_2651851 [Trichonephila clavipes]|nr:hypothetical protein TNCV_2651851 [Trichonephila clavipes]
MSKKRTTAVKVTAELNQHLSSPVSMITDGRTFEGHLHKRMIVIVSFQLPSMEVDLSRYGQLCRGDGIFQDDNAPIYAEGLVQSWFDEYQDKLNIYLAPYSQPTSIQLNHYGRFPSLHYGIDIHHQHLSQNFYGRGSLVVKASDHGWRVMSSSPVLLKIRRVGQRCTLNLSRAETSSLWCGS